MCSIGKSIGKCFQGEGPADEGRFQGKKESRIGEKSVFNVRAQQYLQYLFGFQFCWAEDSECCTMPTHKEALCLLC